MGRRGFLNRSGAAIERVRPDERAGGSRRRRQVGRAGGDRCRALAPRRVHVIGVGLDHPLTWIRPETLAQNPNANAIRWGTMYNFRFESDRPPQVANATIGFFKTGLPITVAIQGPSAGASVNITVGGRVTTNFRGVSYAKVTIADAQGQQRVAFTNTFGYFRFANVASNNTYTVSVLKKNYTFAPQQISPSSDVVNVTFFAPPDPTP